MRLEKLLCSGRLEGAVVQKKKGVDNIAAAPIFITESMLIARPLS